MFFGYQKWFDYEAQARIPYISHGPLIFWMYPVFGIRGACWFLGVAEWFFGGLLCLGFWKRRLGILGALGSTFSFVSTVIRAADVNADYTIRTEPSETLEVLRTLKP